jgi:putative oxidoreductase
MNDLFVKWSGYAPYFQSLLRIAAGVIFVLFGATLLFGVPAAPKGGTPPIMSQMGVGGILEFVGGLLMVVGFLTRPTAFILSGLMAVAYFQFHHPKSMWPTINLGVPAAFGCISRRLGPDP